MRVSVEQRREEGQPVDVIRVEVGHQQVKPFFVLVTPALVIPDPASMSRRSFCPEETSRQVVFPPNSRFVAAGVGRDPLTPKNFTRSRKACRTTGFSLSGSVAKF
jgi:hypothetical protein